MGDARVLLVPGGASTVHGYFPQLEASLAGRATVIEADPPGVGESADGRPLRLPEYAQALARAVRERGAGEVVVVGHSLGGLIALQLAVDEPGLVSGLLLLDPTPLTPVRTLRSMAVSLRVLAALGPLSRRLWDVAARHDLRRVSLDAGQEQAFDVYTDSRFAAKTARWARYLARDGTALAGAVRAGKVSALRTVVVTAGERGAKSSIRRAHEQLVAWIPGAELQVWEGTTHPLHIQRPDRVAEAVLALLERQRETS